MNNSPPQLERTNVRGGSAEPNIFEPLVVSG